MWIVYALGAAITTAAFITLTKKGLESANPTASLTIQAALSLCLAAVFLVSRGEHRTVAEFDRKTWLLVTAAGVAVGVAALLRVLALKNGQAAGVTSIDQLSLALTAVLAIVFLGDEFNWKVAVGVLLMTGGSVLVALGGSRS